MPERTTRGWWSDGTEKDPYETQFKDLQSYLSFLDDARKGIVGWGHSKTSKKEHDRIEEEREKREKQAQDVDPDSNVDPDFGDQEVHKHGGRIKKKKRKKKGRPRGVGKALRGYGKVMKHGK